MENEYGCIEYEGGYNDQWWSEVDLNLRYQWEQQERLKNGLLTTSEQNLVKFINNYTETVI